MIPALPACASRSFTVKSNPPGADVYVDGVYAGVTPVTVPFVYGGEREILVYPPPSRTGQKSFKPKRIIYDTTKDEFDLGLIDFVADLTAAEDRQDVDVTLDESNVRQLFSVDGGEGVRAALRARADTLRSRAREFQLGAIPTSSGKDPGPLESRPESRPEPVALPK